MVKTLSVTRNIRERILNWILIIVSCFIAVYGSEGLLGLFLAKSFTLYSIPPHSSSHIKTPDYDVTYNFNNYGIRGDDMDLTQFYDIVLVGDSYLAGAGVEYDKTVYAHLKNADHKVLNVSELATNPIQYFHKIKILQQYNLRASHFVIGLFFGNDFQGLTNRNIEPALTTQYKDHFLQYDLFSFLKIERWRYMIYSSYKKLFTDDMFVHEFERKIIKTKTMMHPYQKTSETEYLSAAQMNQTSVHKTVKIINLINRNIPRYAKLHVLLIPDRHYVHGDLSTGYETLKQLLVRGFDMNISIVDFHGKLTSEMYYQNDGHWNEMGHKYVANYLIDQRIFTSKISSPQEARERETDSFLTPREER